MVHYPHQPMSATVEWLSPRLLIPTNGDPTIIVHEVARLPCGCACFVGKRADNDEPAASAHACSEPHRALVGRFYGLMLASLDDAREEPLVDVAAELLEEARDGQ